MGSSGLATDPRRPPERELEISVKDGFTLAIVGDVMTSRALAPLRETDASFAAAADLLTAATAAVGNLETSIVEMRAFGGGPRTVDDWAMVADPGVARDLSQLGLRLGGRANNHAADWGREGLLETSAHLDAAGIAHAGADRTFSNALVPRYLETP